MTYKDYCVSRPTEISEIDVYVCECKYVESEKLIRKITKTVPKVNRIHFYEESICSDFSLVYECQKKSSKDFHLTGKN